LQIVGAEELARLGLGSFGMNAACLGAFQPLVGQRSRTLPGQARNLGGSWYDVIALLLGVPVAMTVGWAAGMWTRKRSDRWCGVCGSALNCPTCTSAGAHRIAGGYR
jgi:hypothetical protein